MFDLTSILICELVKILPNTKRKLLLVQVGEYSDHMFTSIHRAATVLPLKPVLHDIVTFSLKS